MILSQRLQLLTSSSAPGCTAELQLSLRCKDDATRCASSSISKRLWLRVLTCDHSAASMTGTKKPGGKHGGLSSSLADLGDFPARFSFEPPAQNEHVQSTAATLRIRIRTAGQLLFEASITGHFRNLNWRYLPILEIWGLYGTNVPPF